MGHLIDDSGVPNQKSEGVVSWYILAEDVLLIWLIDEGATIED